MPQHRSDAEHLLWVYNRFIEVYKVSKSFDYMIRFKKIIEWLAAPSPPCCNEIEKKGLYGCKLLHGIEQNPLKPLNPVRCTPDAECWNKEQAPLPSSLSQDMMREIHGQTLKNPLEERIASLETAQDAQAYGWEYLSKAMEKVEATLDLKMSVKGHCADHTVNADKIRELQATVKTHGKWLECQDMNNAIDKNQENIEELQATVARQAVEICENCKWFATSNADHCRGCDCLNSDDENHNWEPRG